MALNRSDKSRILRRYFPGMTRNSEMSTEPSLFLRCLIGLSAGTVLAGSFARLKKRLGSCWPAPFEPPTFDIRTNSTWLVGHPVVRSFTLCFAADLLFIP